MSNIGYGTLGSSNEPKDLALKFLKKVMLNHKNALKFISLNDLHSVENRFLNSIHILQEFDLMLNHADGNNAVAITSKLITDMLVECEHIVELIDDEQLSADFLEERITNHLIVLNNLHDGFKGMAY